MLTMKRFNGLQHPSPGALVSRSLLPSPHAWHVTRGSHAGCYHYHDDCPHSPSPEVSRVKCTHTLSSQGFLEVSRLPMMVFEGLTMDRLFQLNNKAYPSFYLLGYTGLAAHTHGLQTLLVASSSTCIRISASECEGLSPVTSGRRNRGTGLDQAIVETGWQARYSNSEQTAANDTEYMAL